MSAPRQNKPPWRTETKPPWRTETRPPWRTETKPPWRSKTKPPWRTGTKRPWRTETASLYAWGRYADLDDYAQGFASDIINTLTRIHRMRVPITQETVRLFWDNHVFDHWNTALYARLLALLPGSLLTLPRYRSPGSTDGLGMIPSRQESEIGVVIGLAGSMAGLPDAVGDRVFLKPMPDFETESLRFRTRVLSASSHICMASSLQMSMSYIAAKVMRSLGMILPLSSQWMKHPTSIVSHPRDHRWSITPQKLNTFWPDHSSSRTTSPQARLDYKAQQYLSYLASDSSSTFLLL